MCFVKPQFYGLNGTASNITTCRGNYTAEMFQTDYPQFYTAEGVCLLPESMLENFIDMANANIQTDRWGDSWRFAVGLYVAHYVTLFLRTYTPSSTTAEQAAATGALVGIVKSATLGDSSVTYDTESIVSGTEKWGDLNATTYGQLLATRAKLMGMGGMYCV